LIISLAVLALSIALSSCNARDYSYTMDRQDPKESNIHNFCDRCHKDPERIAGGDICLWCHQYQRDHHPNDIMPQNSELVRVNDSGFPLFEGKVKCLTCHDPHGGPYLTETPKLLRGGPYPNLRVLCYRCHALDRYTQINVHRMIEGDSYRKVNDKVVCNFCHEKVPNPYVDRSRDVTFRADTAFVCWRCHWSMPGQLLDQHLFKAPSPEVLSRMKAYERENNVILPIVPREKITCSTCHNPHQAGVMKIPPAMAGADELKLLRMRREDLCTACHIQ
jgi:predicted CXXCH cytochrome family protein